MKKFLRRNFLAIIIVLGALALISYNQNINIDTETLSIISSENSEGYINLCESGTVCAKMQDMNYKTESSNPSISQAKTLDIFSSGNIVGIINTYTVTDRLGGKFTNTYPANEIELVYWCDATTGNSLTKPLTQTRKTGDALSATFECKYSSVGSYTVMGRFVAVYKNPTYPYYSQHPNGEGALWMGDSTRTVQIVSLSTSYSSGNIAGNPLRCERNGLQQCAGTANKYIQTCTNNVWEITQTCNSLCGFTGSQYYCDVSPNAPPATTPTATTPSTPSTTTPTATTPTTDNASTITASCPTILPSPSAWGVCNSREEKIRTEYYCDSTTGYQPQKVFRTAKCTASDIIGIGTASDIIGIGNTSGNLLPSQNVDAATGEIADKNLNKENKNPFPIVWLIIFLIFIIFLFML